MWQILNFFNLQNYRTYLEITNILFNNYEQNVLDILLDILILNTKFVILKGLIVSFNPIQIGLFLSNIDWRETPPYDFALIVDIRECDKYP